MAKGKFLKIGWFGWTFITVLVVTLAGSVLIFFNTFDLDPMSLAGDSDDQATEKDEISDETAEKVEEVRGTVGKENQAIGQFVSEMHDFYNETTGYGGISSLDWERQKAKANTILDTLDERIADVEDEALNKDLERIQELADAIINGEETENVRSLHRMFHDLDIALNDYNAYDIIWNVTATLDTTN